MLASTVVGSLWFCLTSSRRDCSPPCRVSMSSTQRPDLRPVRTAMFASGYFDHQPRILSGSELASLRPWGTTAAIGCLPGLEHSTLPQEHRFSSSIQQMGSKYQLRLAHFSASSRTVWVGLNEALGIATESTFPKPHGRCTSPSRAAFIIWSDVGGSTICLCLANGTLPVAARWIRYGWPALFSFKVLRIRSR